MNKKLARKVVVHVLAYPEQINQEHWIDGNSDINYCSNNVTDICPTTACLAGWTIYLHGGTAAMGKHVIDTSTMFNMHTYNDAWCKAAAKCLDIIPDYNRTNEYRDLRKIFFDCDNKQAVNKFAALFGLDMEECILDAKKLCEED
jgi:hypothetical protein